MTDAAGRSPEWYEGYQAGMRDCDKRQSVRAAATPETPTGFHCSGCDGHDIDLGDAPLFSHIRNLGGSRTSIAGGSGKEEGTMNEPTTQAGRALVAREAYNSRSFALIEPAAVLAIEQEAVAKYRRELREKVEAISNPEGDARFELAIARVLALLGGAER